MNDPNYQSWYKIGGQEEQCLESEYWLHCHLVFLMPDNTISGKLWKHNDDMTTKAFAVTLGLKFSLVQQENGCRIKMWGRLMSGRRQEPPSKSPCSVFIRIRRLTNTMAVHKETMKPWTLTHGHGGKGFWRYAVLGVWINTKQNPGAGQKVVYSRLEAPPLFT